jgi:hypothetical protein
MAHREQPIVYLALCSVIGQGLTVAVADLDGVIGPVEPVERWSAVRINSPVEPVDLLFKVRFCDTFHLCSFRLCPGLETGAAV